MIDTLTSGLTWTLDVALATSRAECLGAAVALVRSHAATRDAVEHAARALDPSLVDELRERLDGRPAED